MKKAYLILDGGRIFEGYSMGADKASVGELVFNTSVVGYMEALSDPSYYGQILLQTFPLIGNYGVAPQDTSGPLTVSGYVCREICDHPSNFRSEGDLDSFLRENGVPAICGVDTRELTRIIRENGVMSAMITTSLPENYDEIASYKIVGAVDAVSVKNAVTVDAPENKYKATVVDYGVRHTTIIDLARLGFDINIVPHTTPALDILKDEPDVVILSEGPGDPKELQFEIEQIKGIVGGVPVFGIGLGHELLALAMGLDTYKLKYGHRGANQPVSLSDKSHTFITSQNHGYAVCDENIPEDVNVFMRNTNDGTIEGLEYTGKNAFSVQFQPESATEPLKPNYIYTQLINLIERGK